MPPERSAAARVGMALAGRTTRRSLLARAGAALVGMMAGGAAAEAAGRRPRVVPGSNPIGGGWYGFCGHTYTTGSCDSPFGLPRIDRGGRPLRPTDGRPVDDLGRLVDAAGRPVDEGGHPLLGPDGQPRAWRREPACARTGSPSAIRSRRARVGPGTAAAEARSESSSTAARSRAGGSTATRPWWGTATADGTSTASSTTTRGTRADGGRPSGGGHGGGADRGGVRRLVALRAVDDRHDHPRRVRGAAIDTSAPSGSSRAGALAASAALGAAAGNARSAGAGPLVDPGRRGGARRRPPRRRGPLDPRPATPGTGARALAAGAPALAVAGALRLGARRGCAHARSPGRVLGRPRRRRSDARPAPRGGVPHGLRRRPGGDGGRSDARGRRRRRLLASSRGVRRVAVVVTAACAATLALAATGQAKPLPLGGGSQFDPSISGPVFAYAERAPNGIHVVVDGPQGAHRLSTAHRPRSTAPCWRCRPSPASR